MSLGKESNFLSYSDDDEPEDTNIYQDYLNNEMIIHPVFINAVIISTIVVMFSFLVMSSYILH